MLESLSLCLVQCELQENNFSKVISGIEKYMKK